MSNRAAKYEQLHKSLKKHFKTLPEPGERSVLEHLLYACCLEDARSEQADEAFAKLQQVYADWNEVRVTTVIELGEALSSLPNASQAGHRIKRCLQSLFEARYQYDIDDMKKANLSKATEEIAAWKGISPFILNYVSQNALGGHAIPADTYAIEVLVQCEILTQPEADKKTLPGVERAIPKSKGFEFGSLLHQFAVEFHQNPKSPAVLAVFKEMGVTPKAKVIEKPAPKKEVKPVVAVVPDLSPIPVQHAKLKGSAPAPATSQSGHKPDVISETKKPDKKVTPPSKTKESTTKVEAAPEASKLVDAKKKVDSKAPELGKTEAKKPDTKSAAKKPDTKPTTKKSDGKFVSPKQTTDKNATKKPEAKPASKTGDKKSNSSSKSSKTQPPTKKGAPINKPSREDVKASNSKQSASSKINKKKPR